MKIRISGHAGSWILIVMLQFRSVRGPRTSDIHRWVSPSVPCLWSKAVKRDASTIIIIIIIILYLQGGSEEPLSSCFLLHPYSLKPEIQHFKVLFAFLSYSRHDLSFGLSGRDSPFISIENRRDSWEGCGRVICWQYFLPYMNLGNLCFPTMFWRVWPWVFRAHNCLSLAE